MYVIFKHILVIDGWGIFCEIALIWMSLDSTGDQSTLVQVMAWCHQATSHYLNQCWLRSPCGVTRPQWVKIYSSNCQSVNIGSSNGLVVSKCQALTWKYLTMFQHHKANMTYHNNAHHTNQANFKITPLHSYLFFYQQQTSLVNHITYWVSQHILIPGIFHSQVTWLPGEWIRKGSVCKSLQL